MIGKNDKAGARFGQERASLAQSGFKQAAVSEFLPQGNPNDISNAELGGAVGKIMMANTEG